MSTAHLVEPHLAGFQEDFNALRHELAKVVVGHADVIEQVLIAAVAGGHVLIEGVPGLGKTLLVADAGRDPAASLQPHSVHARSHAVGSVGHVRGDGNGRRPPHVRVPAGADLLQSGAGRPDQSRPAEDAVGLAPGDGGRRDQRLDRDLPSAAAVLRRRHAESAGDGRHVPLAGTGDRPLLLQAGR